MKRLIVCLVLGLAMAGSFVGCSQLGCGCGCNNCDCDHGRHNHNGRTGELKTGEVVAPQ